MRRKNVKFILFFFLTLALVPLTARKTAQCRALEFTDTYLSIADLFASLVSGDEGLTTFRSLNIPMGGRAEALGTAYTGLADDISFIDYNPAGSSVLEKTELAFFHNAWIADSALETLAWSSRFNHFGLGAAIKCFYVPFTEYNMFGERVSGGYYSETAAILNASYNFLAGYNFKGIAAGANFKAAYRGVPDYADNITNSVIKNSGFKQSAFALMADFGLLFQFNVAKFYISRDPNFRVGLSANNIGASFTGGDKPQLDDPLPSRLAAGVSYKPIAPVTVTAEFRQPFDLVNGVWYEGWSAALGTAVAVTSFFDAQGGLLLQGGNPRFSLGGSFTVRKFVLNVNYTLDLASTIAPLNRFSLSAKMDLGDRGRAEQRKRVDALYAEGLRAYTQERFEDAVRSWKECLRLDPGFDPAKDGLTAVQNAIQLRARIKDIESID
jgi:hypothetical protein